MGSGVWGLRLRVWFRFRVWGLGFGVLGSGFLWLLVGDRGYYRGLPYFPKEQAAKP